MNAISNFFRRIREAGSNLSSRDNVIRGTIQRFGIGVRDEGEGNDLGGQSDRHRERTPDPLQVRGGLRT